MDNLTTCQIIQASEQASDIKKKLICSQDQIHHSMLESPWAILFYAGMVLFILFMVKRAADFPHRQSSKSDQQD